MSPEPSKPPEENGERIFGVFLYVNNPLGEQTPLTGESGRNYLFMRRPEHGERHVLLCGSVAEYRQVRLDLLGANDRLEKLLGYSLGVDFMTEAECFEKVERDKVLEEVRVKREEKSRGEYIDGLPAGIIGNAHTLVRLKAENAALREHAKVVQPASKRLEMEQEADAGDANVAHLAKCTDAMLEDHAKAFPAEAARMRARVIEIFGRAAASVSSVTVTAPGSGGPVEATPPEPIPGAVEVPGDLEIVERLPAGPMARPKALSPLDRPPDKGDEDEFGYPKPGTPFRPGRDYPTPPEPEGDPGFKPIPSDPPEPLPVPVEPTPPEPEPVVDPVPAEEPLPNPAIPPADPDDDPDADPIPVARRVRPAHKTPKPRPSRAHRGPRPPKSLMLV